MISAIDSQGGLSDAKRAASAEPVEAPPATLAATPHKFHHVHVIVSDSKGYLYAGEVETGRQVQKFQHVAK
jgi:hypothetical protein